LKRNGEPMQPIEDIEALKKRDQDFQKLCQKLAYQPGSLWRIAWQYLENWGVRITKNNAPAIEELSEQSYYGEWKRGTDESIDAINRATCNAELPITNDELNDNVGFMSLRVIQAIAEYKKRVVIGDIGAGKGGTTIAIMDYLDMAIETGEIKVEDAAKCHFYLIEPSRKSIVHAVEAIEAHGLNKKYQVDYTIVKQMQGKHFGMLPQGPMFDIVASNAAFHHMAFPTYVHQIREKLADDGVLVVGDWYTAFWKYPAFVAELLERLGLDGENLERFMEMFCVSRGEAYYREKELEPAQIESNHQMMKYEEEIAKEFRSIPEESRLFFLEGHETLDDRLIKLAEADMEVDINELRTKHKAFARLGSNIKDVHPGSDFATVIAVGKIPGQGVDKTPEKIRKMAQGILSPTGGTIASYKRMAMMPL